MAAKPKDAETQPNISGIAPFVVDPEGWASRTALYRTAVAASEATGSRVPSQRQVYAALRARGFAESKRRGVWGFKGLRADDQAGTGRLVPAGTAASYYRRGDRTDAAREAVHAARVQRWLDRDRATENGEPRATPLSPWYAEPMTPPPGATWSSANRRGARKGA